MNAEDRFSKLYLGKNNIKDEGVKVLSSYLSHSTSLVSLDLTSNSVGPDGARSLF
jgi:Ran GTPase-activating protein (RanGAP) involved in mRNA processing and transport